jgi:PAS domain-containing protein
MYVSAPTRYGTWVMIISGSLARSDRSTRQPLSSPLSAGQNGYMRIGKRDIGSTAVMLDAPSQERLDIASTLQRAIFNSANFSSIATDAKGIIQIFNVGAERMLGFTAAEVTNRITPADISDPQEVIARAKLLSMELATPIEPGFDALVFKASRGIEDIYELTYIRKDGSRLPAAMRSSAICSFAPITRCAIDSKLSRSGSISVCAISSSIPVR